MVNLPFSSFSSENRVSCVRQIGDIIYHVNVYNYQPLLRGQLQSVKYTCSAFYVEFPLNILTHSNPISAWPHTRPFFQHRRKLIKINF